jgi:hypothetical protein
MTDTCLTHAELYGILAINNTTTIKEDLFKYENRGHS